jgi:hypothetical protein
MAEQCGFTGTMLRVCAVAFLAGALLAGCTNGKDGAPGATGPTGPTGPPGPAGPAGPSGPVTALDVSTAQTITATITGVTTGVNPTISFSLAGEIGQPLSGLTAGDISFAIAQLQPPIAGAGTSSQWRSYVTTIEQPSTSYGFNASSTPPYTQTKQVQAKAEGASTTGAVFKDNGDGSYTYTFSKDLTAFATAATANYAAAVADAIAAGKLPAGTAAEAMAYDGTLTHRIGLEIRGTAATAINNAVYTYVPATGATGLANLPLTRDIVNGGECNACHQKLTFHGGPRTDIHYCVVCHNTGTTDANSGNSLDMKVLIHKIHRGISLPTVVAAGTTTPAPGKGFTIWGHNGSLSNFNEVIFPQDQRNCTTCHETADPTTPDADHYKLYPYSQACGTCHDNVNWTTGANHGPAPGIIATDKDCVVCHGPNSNLLSNGVPMTVVGAHTIPELAATANFKFQVTKIEAVADAAGTIPGATPCAAGATACVVNPGEYVKVTLLVTNPVAGTNYDLVTDAGFSPTSFVPGSAPGSISAAPSITVDLAYTTLNYTGPTNPQNTNPNRSPPITVKFLSYNTGAGLTGGAMSYAAATATATSGQPPAKNGDGSYTRVAPVPTTSAALIGINGNVSGAAFVEGRAVINVAPAGQIPSYSAIGISAADPTYFPIVLPSGATQAVARRAVVDINNCNTCHKQLQFHGDARNNSSNLCSVCHNPEMTTGSFPAAAGQAASGPMDFKFLIHGIHSANYNYGSHNFTSSAPPPVPYPILPDFSSVPVVFPYPGAVNNCEACHVKGADTFYPVDPTQVFSTTVWGGGSAAGNIGPQDDLAITPNVAACGACHVTTLAQAHMQQNGGVIVDPFYAGNYANQITAMGGSIKNADGTTKAAFQTETCGVCHGKGAIADVKVVHNIAAYQ